MTSPATSRTTFGARLASLVSEAPDAPALTDDDGTLSRAELDSISSRWAQTLLGLGVRSGDIVSICLPSDRRYLLAAWAAWKVGATPQPLSSRIAPQELRAIVEVTRPALLIGVPPVDLEVPVWDPSVEDQLAGGAAGVPLDAIAPSWKAPTSGGSTGRPKVIVSATAAIVEPLDELAGLLRIEPGEVLLTPAPLHHNAPFLFTSLALLRGGHAIVMRRFDAAGVLERAAAHDVTWLYAVPTIMSRIAKLPAEVAAAADLSSLRTLYHMAAPCPSWLKRWWIDRIGPEKVWELYTGTEFQAVTIIGGDDWLAHPGSVGTVQLGSMMVLDDDGNQVPPNQVGEIYLRAPGGRPTYTYLGGTAKARGEWESLGDVGSMDADGYVYLSDRAKDIVLVGGVNVYPAEVEAALETHPLVLSCCVVGLPDEDLGERLHAVVQLADDLEDDAILDFLSDRLASYKQPRSFSRSEVPLRDEAGKVRRAAVRDLVLAEAATTGPGGAGGR